ncbi:HNH endonuclease signature motif containing protein [Pleomorphomonas sp. JP5]|uniref:HNH endonuclease signature motif containing protein n=1 Tax=Pleomorphomonas sp. JP5 TaxID=2942998 RepID=UPI0038621D62
MADWPYNTAAWQRLRAAKLAESPLCEPCKRRGVVRPARHVDHIRSITSGGDAFPSFDGLMSMCASCHSIKTNAVDRRGGSGIRFKGVDIDGLPIDPDHPFFAEGYTPSDHQPAGMPDRLGGRTRTKFWRSE